MRFSQVFLGFGLGVTLALLGSASAIAQTSTDVVAQIGAVKLTMSDLEQQESAKLLQARYDFYQAESKALDDLIDKTLIQQKARSQNLTVDQLLDREVKSQVKDPTEDQLKIFYEGLETDQPYEAMRGRILDKIRATRTSKARLAYIKTLRAESNVYVTLAPPSTVVDLENANVLGSKDAPVLLVEFADYECPYCQKVAPAIKKLREELGGKLAVAYKDFPLPMHAHAEKAAEAVRCAGKQGQFWAFHDELFCSKELDIDQLKAQARALKLDSAAFDQCLDTGETAAVVQQDREQGLRLGLSGTPSFFVNGHFLSGALDYDALRKIVDQQLAQPLNQAAITANR
ncbi:MAG: thioredoxin domain-containing protein [Terriglobales bacterium]